MPRKIENLICPYCETKGSFEIRYVCFGVPHHSYTYICKNCECSSPLGQDEDTDKAKNKAKKLLFKFIDKLTYDTKLLNYLEKSFGAALIHDDDSHWAIASDGIQNIGDNQGEPFELQTVHWIEKHAFKKSIREAIESFRKLR